MKGIKTYLHHLFIDGLSGMALGLFATLIVGTILEQIAALIAQIGAAWCQSLASGLVLMAGVAKALTGAGIGAGVAQKFKESPLVTVSAAVAGMVGAFASKLLAGAALSGSVLTLAGPGEPLGAFVAAYTAIELGHLVSGKTKVDILVTPIVSIVTGSVVGLLLGPPISSLMSELGGLINWATMQQPFWMGILVSVIMGIVLTLPISSAALGIVLGLSGIAAAGGDGLPLFIPTLAIRAAMVMTVASAARLGTTVLAGFQAVNSSWNFAMNMLDSVGIAGQTLVGAAMGAGDRARTLRLTRATGRAGLAAGAAIGCGFAVAGLFVGRLFSPNPHVQLLVAAGMVTMGAFLPLQGWMMALDGILIGARDFRYLAITCTLTATVYIALTAICVDAAAPMLPGDLASTVLLWAMFNIVLMGGRGLFNGLRIRSESWLGQTAL